MLPKYTMACLLIGAGLAAAADAQPCYPYMGGFGGWPYPDTYQYYSGFHGYYPNVSYFFDHAPRPLTGNYLPSRPLPPLSPFRIPSTGLVPQPYPYSYQPPLYGYQSYVWPYYPATPVPPFYYQRPFTTPRPLRRSSRRYSAVPERLQSVAPAGSETSPGGYVVPRENGSIAKYLPTSPNAPTP